MPCLLAAACGPFVTACGPVAAEAEKPRVAAPGASASAKASSSAQAASPRVLPDDVDFEINVTPSPSPSPLVRVRLGARGDGLTVWQSPKPIDLAGKPEAADTIGPIDVTVDSAGGGTRLTLSKAPTGTMWITYTVRGGAADPANPPPVLVDPDRFAAAGEGMIVVPAGFEDKAVRATLRTEMDEIGVGEFTAAATSFGLGAKVAATARGADLRSSYFLAGFMGQAHFRAPEGNDDAGWLGFTAFDPRPGFADMAGFRTALRQLFGSADGEQLTLLIISDRRNVGDFAVTRRPRSVVAWVGDREPWGAPLRIAVATAVVHGWIGGRLWIGPSDAAHESEAYWFTEGIARHLARDLLFRFGLVSPSEAAQEVEGLASVLATSPRGADSNEALRKDPKGALPVLVARGALYGLRTDAKLRAKSGGKTTLQNVLRELYGRAAEAKGPLPASAWVDAVAKELGDGERAAFHDAIDLGKPFDLPDNSLGPCFKKVTRSYVGYEPGFDEQATLKAQKITGLVKGGPADKAGLHEGDRLSKISVDRGAGHMKVEITIRKDDMTPVTFSYKPEGKKGKGPGFDRKKDVADDACTP